MSRFVLGPGFGLIHFPGETTEPEPTEPKIDIAPAVVSAEPDSGIVLDYPAFNPETEQAPVRTYVYLLPEGQDRPETAEAWVNSPHPYSYSSAPVSPDGEPAYAIPAPVAPPGNYLGQVVLEYAD